MSGLATTTTRRHTFFIAGDARKDTAPTGQTSFNANVRIVAMAGGGCLSDQTQQKAQSTVFIEKVLVKTLHLQHPVIARSHAMFDHQIRKPNAVNQNDPLLEV